MRAKSDESAGGAIGLFRLALILPLWLKRGWPGEAAQALKPLRPRHIGERNRHDRSEDSQAHSRRRAGARRGCRAPGRDRPQGRRAAEGEGPRRRRAHPLRRLGEEGYRQRLLMRGFLAAAIGLLLVAAIAGLAMNAERILDRVAPFDLD